MRFRKLRIAWSVAWGVVAVLLCVLWVRSFWRADELQLQVTQLQCVITQSSNGTIESTNFRVWDAEAGDWDLVHDEIANPDDKESVIWWGDHGSLEFALQFGTDVDDETFYYIRLPHWFCSFIIGIIAAVPWFRWSKRFSLRTLLIATTLVAVVLGTIVWMSRAE